MYHEVEGDLLKFYQPQFFNMFQNFVFSLCAFSTEADRIVLTKYNFLSLISNYYFCAYLLMGSSLFFIYINFGLIKQKKKGAFVIRTKLRIFKLTLR